MKITTISVLGIICCSSSLAAMNGDSVMQPTGAMSSAPVKQSEESIQAPSLVSSSNNQVRYATCPSGFTYSGSHQYPAEIRSVVSYYLNNTKIGESTSAWTDLDSSCTKTEEKSIACPVNYRGSQKQRRTVATKDGKTYDYSAWNTYQSNCVYNPPLKAGYLDLSIISARSSSTAYFQFGCPVSDCTAVSRNSYKNIDKAVRGSRAGLTIYPKSGQFACIAAGSGTPGGGESNSGADQHTYILPPNKSFEKGSYDGGKDFSCTLSNKGKAAVLYGDCNSTTGGDGDMCMAASLRAEIVGISGCVATVKTGRNKSGDRFDSNPPPVTTHYDLCQ